MGRDMVSDCEKYGEPPFYNSKEMYKEGRDMHTSGKASAIALEAVGCCVILAGIIIEIIYEADIGFICCTTGAWFAAIGGLIFGKLIRKK